MLVESIDDFRTYRRSITRRSALLGAGILVLCATVQPGDMRLLMGLALGFVFSLLKFRLSCNNLIVSTDKAPEQARSYLVQRRFITYTLTAAVLAVAFWRNGLFNGWATAGGAFLTSVVLILDVLFGRRPAASTVEPVEGT